MFLFASAFVFLVFFSNVALGAFADGAFLGDVGEMVVLFCASILFVIAILKRESDRDANSGNK